MATTVSTTTANGDALIIKSANDAARSAHRQLFHFRRHTRIKYDAEADKYVATLIDDAVENGRAASEELAAALANHTRACIDEVEANKLHLAACMRRLDALRATTTDTPRDDNNSQNIDAADIALETACKLCDARHATRIAAECELDYATMYAKAAAAVRGLKHAT